MVLKTSSNFLKVNKLKGVDVVSSGQIWVSTSLSKVEEFSYKTEFFIDK